VPTLLARSSAPDGGRGPAPLLGHGPSGAALHGACRQPINAGKSGLPIDRVMD